LKTVYLIKNGKEIMFKILMITAVIILALGWSAYGIWVLRERRKEKNLSDVEIQAKKSTEHLNEVRKSFDEYTKNLEKFKRKTYKREELQ